MTGSILNDATETVPVDQVKPHPQNPRMGDVGAIHESIAEHGFYGVIVAQRSSGHILVGNHRWKAARLAGYSEIPVTWIDVSDEQALRILLVDNRTNDLATYDDELLGDLLTSLAEGGNLVGTGFDGDAVDLLLRDLGRLDHPPPVPAGASAADEAQTRWNVEPGQTWIAGPHRVLCADSRDAAVLAALASDARCLVCDPPYGIGLDTDYRSMENHRTRILGRGREHSFRPFEGDDEAYDPAPVVEAFRSTPEQFWFGADYYRRHLSEDDYDGSWLVWDKRNESSDGGFGSGFELVWSRERHQRRVLRHYYFGAFGEDARNRVHPTQKPVPLIMDIIERWTEPGAVVADPYLGSGTTLVAAHRSNRVGRGCEIDPAYVAVTLDRLAALGLTPERV